MVSITTSPVTTDQPGAVWTSSHGRSRKLALQAAKTLATAVIALIFISPILWWLLASIKTTPEILHAPPRLFNFASTLNWYRVVLQNADPTSFNVEATGSVGRGSSGSTFYSFPYLRDSAIIAIGSTVLVLLLGTPAAYALSRFRMRRRKDLALWFLSQRMMPPVVIAFPLFIMYRDLNLMDTYLGMILVHTAINAPLAVLLLMSFFDEVPADLDDAAMIDGATRFGAFRSVVLHYVGGGVAATAVLTFVFSWNEFLLSLVLTTGIIRTVPVASSTFTTAFATEWGYMAALGTASMVPVFIFILLVQRHLVRGLTMGAAK